MKGLRPFFSYFGSKYRLAKHYSEPKYDQIVEPFAGSAGYSLFYPDREVFLVDAYEPIVELWQYLIKVKPKEILSLPLGPFSKDNPIETHVECSAARLLIGFWATESQTYASRYSMAGPKRRKNGIGGNWTEQKRQLIAEQLQYISHWQVRLGDYTQIDNFRATWFVDPPYQKAGKRYKCNDINFSQLGDWCKSRKGQAIVCEQQGADWLPFTELRAYKNASNKPYTEVVWEKG